MLIVTNLYDFRAPPPEKEKIGFETGVKVGTTFFIELPLVNEK